MSTSTPISADPAEPDTSVAAPATSERAPASAWYALAVLIVATVLGSVDQTIFVLLIEPMRHTLSMSDTQIGLIRGVGMVLFAGLASLPLGWLSDRYDRRFVLAGCVVLWSAATALRGWAPDYGMLFVASIGLAVGEAGLGPITYSLIPDLFPRRQRALANGLFALSSLFGAALGAMLGGAIVTAVEAGRHRFPASMQGYEVWRLTFFVLASVGLPASLLVLSIRRTRRGPRAVQPAAVEIGARTDAGEPLLSYGDYLRAHWRTLGGLVVGTGVASIGMAAVGVWIPVLAAREFGITPAQLGQGIGLAVIGGTLLGALLGLGAMRLSRRITPAATALRVTILGYLVMMFTSAALPFARSATDLFVLLTLLMAPLVAAAVVAPNALQDASPPHLRGRVLTLLVMAGLPFSVLGPLLIGVLSDALKSHPNGLAYAVVAVTLLASVIGALVLRATEAPLVRLVQAMQRQA